MEFIQDPDVEHQLIVTRLSEKTSSSRIEGIEFLREHLKRNNGALKFKDKESIFKGLSLSLEDTSWKIRHLTIEVLRDMIPKFGDDLDDLYAPMLPQLIENIGDNKVEVRKDVVQTLHTYMKNSMNVGFLLQLYLEFGLQSEDEKVQKESIINLPLLMSPEFANEDLFEISQTLLGKIPGNEDPRSIWRCIERLKLVVGEDKFDGYVSHMGREYQEIYRQKLNAPNPPSLNLQHNNNTHNQQSNFSNDSAPSVQTPHTTLTARELAAKLTAASNNDPDSGRMPGLNESSPRNGANMAGSSKWGVEFGIIKPDVMIRLTNREDWQLRLHGIEDLKTDVTQLNDVSNLKPDLVDFIKFLCRFLTDEVNFKITMSTLEIFVVLIKKLGALSCQYVEPLAAALSHRLGDSKIVIRQLNSRAFRELMYTATPMPVLEQILPCLKHRNSRVREETINVIISALLTFPTTDFDFTTLCDTISPCLADPKRRVRQAALEVFAVLAQLMGVNNLKPLIRAIEMLEPEFGDGPMNAIKARVARRQLPMIKENGMVDYATSVAGSAVSSAAGKSRSSSSNGGSPSLPASAGSTASNLGADVDWILKASGSSRGGNLPGDSGIGSSGVGNNDSIASESVPSSATERRAVVLSSAGKKLPWDPNPLAQQPSPNHHLHMDLDSHDHLPNGFKKPLIPPSKNRNTFGSRAKAYNSEELQSSNLSSGYISMRNTARPHSDTSDLLLLEEASMSSCWSASLDFSLPWKSLQQQSYQDRPKAAAPVARDSPSRRQQPTIGHATNDLSSGSAGEDDIGLQGCFPTKPQLARSATSRDQKAFKNQGGSDNKEAPPEAEDLPIDEKALCSVRNSAAKKKAEKRTNTADSSPYNSGGYNDTPNQTQNANPATSTLPPNGLNPPNTMRSKGQQQWSREQNQTVEAVGKLDLENLPVETPQQKVEMYTAVRKSFNAQSYKDKYESAKYSSAPIDMYFNGDSPESGGMGGAGDTEMSNFTRRKIDDLKEKKRMREKEEQKAAARVAQQHKTMTGAGGKDNSSRGEEAWVEPTLDARTSLNSAPVANKTGGGGGGMTSYHGAPPNSFNHSSSNGATAGGGAPPKHKSSFPNNKQSSTSSNSSPLAAAAQPPPPQLRSTPDVELKRAMNLIQNQDWGSKCEGIALLSVMSEKYPEVLGAQMHDVNLAVVAEVKNLRSQVAREAIKLMRTLFKNLDKRMDMDLELTVGCLLTKTGESSGFIRDDVEKALTTMAEKTTPARSIAALAQSSAHKSKEVRKTASYILCIIIERVLDPSRGVKARQETISQAVSAIACFALDSAPEARFYGKKMLWLLMQEDPHNLETSLQKSVQPSNVHPLKKLMETLRNNGGPGEHPNETPSAKLARKPSYNSRTFSGGSIRLDSSALDDQMNGTFPSSAGGGSKSHPMNSQSHSNGGGNSSSSANKPASRRVTDDDKESVRSICSNLKSGDFRDRENAIVNLVDLSRDRPELIGGQINAIFDEFIHRLTDSNSKVNLLALQSMLQLVPLLRDYFSSVANMVVPAVAQNLSSYKNDIRNLSLDIIDVMIDHIDQTSLLQPFSTLARFGNNRVRPDIILKLATLVTHMYPRKPQMVIRHVLPVLWQLVGNLSGSGAMPGSSTNLRQAAQRLATNLYSFMGQNLIDMADSELSAPRTKLTLKQLVEVS